MIHNWMRMLFAVLMGNVIYFVMQPVLPEPFKHDIYKVDAGLLVDLAICAALYLAIRKKPIDDANNSN